MRSVSGWLRARLLEPVWLPSDIQVETVEGADVPAQLFSVRGASRSRFILYLHGGGFLTGIANLHRDLISSLSRGTGESVLLPDYRLAPEHPFPAALEDCIAAYRWLLQQGVAPSKIVVAGESAGGNLTLALALALRDRGKPLPAALVALSPILDHALTGKSYRTKAHADPAVSRDLLRRSIAAYTHNGAVDVRHPLVSPLYAEVRGLPPTLILVGSQEVVLSDATRMADHLRKALVPVTLEVWPGMIHIWFALPERLMPEVVLARQHIVTFIERSLVSKKGKFSGDTPDPPARGAAPCTPFSRKVS